MTNSASAGVAIPFSSPSAPKGWRHQLPVYSPFSAGAFFDGLRAAVASAAAVRAREELIAILKERFGSSAVLLTDSGTSALTAALSGALADRPGSAVALPAFACYDVATAADGAAAPVLLYDVDPHSLVPDLESVRVVLRRGAAAIVVPHLYGYPVDLAEVNRLAAAAGAIVIEDAAQAAGATLDGRPAGALSALSVLSFGRGKGWTGGGGGALLAFDAAGVRVLNRARTLLAAPRRGGRELLALGVQLLLARPHVYALPAALPFLRLGQTIYREPHPPRAPAAAACAVVIATRLLMDRELTARRRNAEHLLVALRHQPAFETIRAAPDAQPGYLRLPVLASPAARRAAAESSATRLGVSPAYPRALADLPGFGARCRNHYDSFPGARLLASRLCTLPTHSRLDAADLTRLQQWIRVAGGLSDVTPWAGATATRRAPRNARPSW